MKKRYVKASRKAGGGHGLGQGTNAWDRQGQCKQAYLAAVCWATTVWGRAYPISRGVRRHLARKRDTNFSRGLACAHRAARLSRITTR